MPEIISQPPPKPKVVVSTTKCSTCKTKAKYFDTDTWVEDDYNVVARCAGCGTVIFLKNTYA